MTWTVEWLHADGLRELQQCGEHEAVLRHYISLPSQREINKKRKQEKHSETKRSSKASKKQKRLPAARTAQENPSESSPPNVPVGLTKAEEEPVSSVSTEKVCDLPQEIVEERLVEGRLEDDTLHSTHEATTEEFPKVLQEEALEEIIPENPSSTHQDVLRSEPSVPVPTSTKAAELPQEKVHFYLAKPFTTGRNRILLPISSNTTLFQCLPNKTVSEFPTIQVLSQPPDLLPNDYVLETE